MRFQLRDSCPRGFGGGAANLLAGSVQFLIPAHVRGEPGPADTSVRARASDLAFTRGSAAVTYSSQQSKSLLEGRRSVAARRDASLRSSALAAVLAARDILVMCRYSLVDTLKVFVRHAPRARPAEIHLQSVRLH